MIYKQFGDIKLSSLGLGTMRLPVKDGKDSEIDETAAAEMIDYALKNGINYFDTAWGYHGGNSEPVVGKILSNYPRDSFCLATKFPGYDLSNIDKVEIIFEKQLERCRTDYFDFYLFHNVCEMNIEQYFDPKYGIFDYLLKQKENGRIKHLGFSAHGSYNVVKRFLEAYGKHLEFCQLQINYLDYHFQEADRKMELLKSYGIPVWVMEPLRGGRLVSVNKEYENQLKRLRPDDEILTWAFRFIQSLPEVVVTLSGMSDFNQLKDNIEIFSTDAPLDTKEWDTLLNIADDMVRRMTLLCTGCRYCTSHCPKGLDIPELLKLYNEHSFSDGGFIAPMAMMALDKEKQPSACIGCKSCEAVCPQQIKISIAMKDFSAKLEGFVL